MLDQFVGSRIKKTPAKPQSPYPARFSALNYQIRTRSSCRRRVNCMLSQGSTGRPADSRPSCSDPGRRREATCAFQTTRCLARQAASRVR
jgi:hypothetical protein